MAAATRVVASTVGPYARTGAGGGGLRRGRHALRRPDRRGAVRAAQHRALPRPGLSTGARIVHSCGFDSVPSDLGVLLAHEQAQADGEGPLEDTTLVVTDLRGGVSGGTVDSMRLQLEAARHDPALRRVLADPYALSPDRAAEPDLGRQRDVAGVSHDAGRGEWLAPFVMASYNTRDRPAQQRADGLGVRAAVPLPGGDGVPGGGHRAAVGVRRDRRAGGARCRACGSARPGRCWTGCCPTPARGRTRRPGRGQVPGRGAGHDDHRRVVHRGGGRLGRPRLRRDGGDAGGERGRAGPGRGPARPRRGAHPGHRAGGRAGGPAARRRLRAVGGGRPRVRWPGALRTG